MFLKVKNAITCKTGLWGAVTRYYSFPKFPSFLSLPLFETDRKKNVKTQNESTVHKFPFALHFSSDTQAKYEDKQKINKKCL